MGFGLYPGFGLQPDAASALRVVTEPFSLACSEFGFVFVETPRRMSAQQFCLQPVLTDILLGTCGLGDTQ